MSSIFDIYKRTTPIAKFKLFALMQNRMAVLEKAKIDIVIIVSFQSIKPFLLVHTPCLGAITSSEIKKKLYYMKTHR